MNTKSKTVETPTIAARVLSAADRAQAILDNPQVGRAANGAVFGAAAGAAFFAVNKLIDWLS